MQSSSEILKLDTVQSTELAAFLYYIEDLDSRSASRATMVAWYHVYLEAKTWFIAT